MGFLTAIVGSLWQFIAKTFLGGIFGNAMAHAEDQAQTKMDAAKEHAETTQESADVEVQVIHDQVKVKEDEIAKPVDPADPFGNADWNSKK